MKIDPELQKEIDEAGEKLTRLQKAFVTHLVGGDLTPMQAYYKAGGRSKTDDTARASYSEILAHPNVKAFKLLLERAALSERIMTREEAMALLSKQARANIKDFANFAKHQVGEDENGNPIYQSVWDFKGDGELADDDAACITELTAGRDGLKFKIQSQAQAIKQLADMAGWNAAVKQEHSGQVGVNHSGVVANVEIDADTDPKKAADIYRDLMRGGDE